MSSIRLTHRETEGKLPMVCMVCGRNATLRKSQMFRWSPFWFYGGPSGYAGLATLALSKYKSVEVPLCDEDKDHFWKPLRGGLIIAGIFIVIFMLTFVTAPIVIALDLPFVIPFLFGIGAFVFLIATFVWYTIHVRGKYIRASGIDERGVNLENVASGFVRAMQRKRKSGDAEDEEDFVRRDVSALGIFNTSRPAPRRRRRSRRDDEDDDEDDEE